MFPVSMSGTPAPTASSEFTVPATVKDIRDLSGLSYVGLMLRPSSMGGKFITIYDKSGGKIINDKCKVLLLKNFRQKL
jgi:hypothetical protein